MLLRPTLAAAHNIFFNMQSSSATNYLAAEASCPGVYPHAPNSGTVLRTQGPSPLTAWIAWVVISLQTDRASGSGVCYRKLEV